MVTRLQQSQLLPKDNPLHRKHQLSLWAAIKARFGGNKESKKMQKNLLKQQFETFVVGAREELDSAYDRFQNIISILDVTSENFRIYKDDVNL
ncbi:hypothetical protein Tco_0949245 [Tanacetum coccineum]